MSETKSGDKRVGHSENFHYHSENFATIAKFRYVCEIFAMSNRDFFLKKINKIINNKQIIIN